MQPADGRHFAYDLLIELSKQNVSEQDLEDIKRMYAAEIGSRRRMEDIKTPGDLIDVLENRDIIHENNVKALKNICNKKIINKLNEYESELEEDENLNIYSLERLNNGAYHPVQLLNNSYTKNNISSPPPLSRNQFIGDKRQKILKLITIEIGKKWRDLGRGLGIREGEMDAIENDYPKSRERVYKMFQMFEEDERVDPSHIFLTICNALEDCRRKDLSQTIRKIMAR